MFALLYDDTGHLLRLFRGDFLHSYIYKIYPSYIEMNICAVAP